MSIRPLEQKEIESNVLKKWKVEPKYAILAANAFAKNRRFSKDMNLPLCNKQLNITQKNHLVISS
jgi:hypothetical protein